MNLILRLLRFASVNSLVQRRQVSPSSVRPSMGYSSPVNGPAFMASTPLGSFVLPPSNPGLLGDKDTRPHQSFPLFHNETSAE
jgi:hypothetical protein